MKLLLIEKLREPENSTFLAEGAALGISVLSVDPSLLTAQLASNEGSREIQKLAEEHDALVVRSYRQFGLIRETARAFKSLGKPVFGLATEHHAYTQDKLSDLFDLQRAGVPVPKTWIKLSELPPGAVVEKDNWGYGGFGVRMLEEADRPKEDDVNKHYQEFLPALCDWRILVCEGTALPLVVVRSPLVGDFRTNTHQGVTPSVGDSVNFKGATQMMALAERACAALGRPCGGVDLRQGLDGAPVVLEVNRTPRLRLGEHTTAVVRKYLQTWKSHTTS